MRILQTREQKLAKKRVRDRAYVARNRERVYARNAKARSGGKWRYREAKIAYYERHREEILFIRRLEWWLNRVRTAEIARGREPFDG